MPTGDDVLLRVSLLAAGIVGRAVAIRLAPPGDPIAWTDGAAIHLSADAGSERDLAILVQAALLRAGSLSPSIAVRLVGRPRLAQRYLAVEAPRALALIDAVSPRRLRAHPALAAAPLSSSADESLRLASRGVGVGSADPMFGAIRPARLLRAAPVVPRVAASQTAAQSEAGDAEDGGAGDESTLLKLMSNGLGLSALGEMLRRLLAMAPRSSGEPEDGDAGAALSEGEARRVGRGPTAAQGDRVGSGVVFPSTTDPASFRYPEWDPAIGRYRPGWTSVTDYAPVPAESSVPAVEASFSPSPLARRQIAMLRLGLEPHRREASGDELVIEDVVRLMVEQGAGGAPDERVYRGLRRTRRTLGVLILIDNSSSVRDVAAGGGTVQQNQLTLAWQIADGLAASGQRTAIYGFNSRGRERVAMARFKGFDDRFGQAAARMVTMEPTGFTRTGAAVRHAGHVVATRAGTLHRLVILITDGLPYDAGYELAHGEEDTRRAIAELRARDIHCLCLSVGSDADASKLSRVFGDSAFMTAERPDAIVGTIGPRLRAILARGFGPGGDRRAVH